MTRILLVEDSKVQAFVALRMLRDAGYTVDHAETAEDAVKSCYEDVPNLVLLDQHLADVSGLEVCRRIKNDNALNATPVLVLTASNKEKDHIASLDAGADAFLPKDGPTNELLAVMSRLLETSAGVSRPDASDPSSKPMITGRTQILVIDDSPTFRDVIRKKLVGAGFETTEAASGADGLALLEQEPFDVVVVDVVMPEMDGFEFCSKARQWAIEQKVHLGLLVLTGSDRNEALVEALDAGADDYVSKLQEFDVILAHTTALARRIIRARQSEWANLHAAEHLVTEQSERMKSKLLAELREGILSPLNSINFALESLRSSELNSEQRNQLDTLQQSVIEIQTVFGGPRDDSQVVQDESDPTQLDDVKSDSKADGQSDGEHEVDMSVFNLQAAEKRVPGGKEGIRMVAEMLLVECPKMMTQIRTAVENGDAPLLKRGAHTLKGSADVFDAKRVYDAAYVLEKMGGTGDLSDVEPRLHELEDEVAKLTRALECVIKQQ